MQDEETKKKLLGFTLIEILLAVALSSMVTIALFSLFRAGLKTWQVVQFETRCMRTARLTFAPLEEDLRNLVPGIGKVVQGQAIPNDYVISALTPNTTNSNITFFSNRGGVLNVVRYNFENNPTGGGGPRIYRQAKNVLDWDGAITNFTEQDIAQNFSNVNIMFLPWDGNSLGAPLTEWTPGGPNCHGLPAAIIVTLEFDVPEALQGGGRKKQQWTKTMTIPHAIGVL